MGTLCATTDRELARSLPAVVVGRIVLRRVAIVEGQGGVCTCETGQSVPPGSRGGWIAEAFLESCDGIRVPLQPAPGLCPQNFRGLPVGFFEGPGAGLEGRRVVLFGRFAAGGFRFERYRLLED
jgi:hypothetical protein